MSQYGAEGMANNGYNYKEILEHYYQGTTIKNLYNWCIKLLKMFKLYNEVRICKQEKN